MREAPVDRQAVFAGRRERRQREAEVISWRVRKALRAGMSREDARRAFGLTHKQMDLILSHDELTTRLHRGARTAKGREALLSFVVEAARILGKDRLAVAEYEALRRSGQLGERPPQYLTISRAFGGWRKACEAAGLRPHADRRRAVRISDEEALRAVIRVRDRLGHWPTSREYKDSGERTIALYSLSIRFGGWGRVLEEAAKLVGGE
jgi:hypothetical protein